MTKTLRRFARFLAVVTVKINNPGWSVEEVERDIPDHLHDGVVTLQSRLRRKRAESGQPTVELPYEVTSIDTVLYAKIEREEEE